MPDERQLTTAPHGHVLTNVNVWSPDGDWIVYDTRPDPAGSVFDGDRIERVNARTGEVELLYQSRHGARCGVVTHHPTRDQIVFILGPEHPTPDWSYAPDKRQGVTLTYAPATSVAPTKPRHSCRGPLENLDARDLTPPFTPGALRGGTHVHVFHPTAPLVSFTYNDHIAFPDQRNVGVAILNRPVTVPPSQPRNHPGQAFSVLVTRTTAAPRPGSDDIRRAFDDAWVGPDARAIAFIGETLDANSKPLPELFIANLPPNLTIPGDAPLEGTETTLPAPPRGTIQRRLTFTADRKHPGLCTTPRHWVRSAPDGSRIAFIMRDDAGLPQLWTIAPAGQDLRQLTRNHHPIASAFTWSPDGRLIAHTMDHSVCVTDADTGQTRRVTPPTPDNPPRPEACVFSPDGRQIAFTRTIAGFNQVFVVS